MAKTKGVWGIDIGQSALKALRCHKDDEGNVVADSYDFIEYPNCLLYTSPSPRDLSTSRMPSSA